METNQALGHRLRILIHDCLDKQKIAEDGILIGLGHYSAVYVYVCTKRQFGALYRSLPDLIEGRTVFVKYTCAIKSALVPLGAA